MKRDIIYCLAVVLIGMTGNIFAEDISTASGMTYTNAKVIRVEPDGISCMHSRGITKLFFHELTPEMQQRFGYDPAKASAYRKNTIQAQAEWERRQQTAAQQQLAEQQQRLDAVRTSEKQKEAEQKIKSQSQFMRVEVLQILDGGGLAIPYDRVKGGFRPGRAQYVKEYGDALIFIEGLPATLVDGEEWKGNVSAIGVYQYESLDGGARTVRRYKAVE